MADNKGGTALIRPLRLPKRRGLFLLYRKLRRQTHQFSSCGATCKESRSDSFLCAGVRSENSCCCSTHPARRVGKKSPLLDCIRMRKGNVRLKLPASCAAKSGICAGASQVPLTAEQNLSSVCVIQHRMLRNERKSWEKN